MSNEKKTENLEIPGAVVEINLLDYLLVLVKYKRMILGVTLGIFLLSCVGTLLFSNVYTATARILPSAKSRSVLPAAFGDGRELASLAGISVPGTSSDNFMGLLNSRTVADAIIDQFDLMEVYNESSRTKTYKALSDNVTISTGDLDEIISVSVDDNVPERAAEIANAYLEELRKLNLKLNLRSAGRERAFLESRLKLVKKDLMAAEENLKTFQQQNKAIRIDAQTVAIIEAVAELRAELAAKEVELGALLTYQTENNPNVVALQKTIDKIKEQLQSLEQSKDGDSTSDIFIATSDMPHLGIQYTRVLREFKIEEALYELLVQRFEMAKIEEAKNTTHIQILDEAVAPDEKTSPPRALIVLVLTFIAALCAVTIAFVREFLEHLPHEDLKKWQVIKAVLPRYR